MTYQTQIECLRLQAEQQNLIAKTAMQTAANSIEKLMKERDGYFAEWNKFQLYLQRTHADWELEVAAVDALNAKLTKAVEALRGILKGDDMYPWRIAREALAELEAKE